MQTSSLTKFTKVLLDLLFYLGIVVTVTLPISFHFIGIYYPTIGDNYIAMTVLFFISGVLALIIIGNLRKMFKTVLNEDCFVEDNVIALKRMGVASFLISVINILRLFVVVTPATLIIILVFFIAGLFSLVLAQVFGQAVDYKEETDYTI